MSLACGSPALSTIEPEMPDVRAREYWREIGGDCELAGVGKFRNGRPKVWCKTHAQVVKDVEASECTHGGSVVRLRCLSLQVDRYAGGLGIWGSLPPAIDTATSDMDTGSLLQGVHVHARPEPKAKKEIDETYDVVVLFRDEQLLVTLDTNSATALVQSRIAGLETRSIRCPRCHAEHIDEGWFAVTPHRKHQCLCCGREFYQKTTHSGSIIGDKLKEIFPPAGARVDPNRQIDLARHMAAGRHIRMWGTHHALVWTAPRPEEAGVHVHVYNPRGEYVVDETFDSVVWGDIRLDATEVRLLMLQKSLGYLCSRIASACCSQCAVPLLSEGAAAVNPSRRHQCNRCGGITLTRKKLVLNPLSAFESTMTFC